jgi:hypothetical protein
MNIQTQNVRMSGVMQHFNAGEVTLDQMQQAFANHGVADHVPDCYSRLDAAEKALREARHKVAARATYWGSGQRHATEYDVVRRKDCDANGWEILDILKGTSTNKYSVIATAKLTSEGMVVETGSNHLPEDHLNGLFNTLLSCVPGKNTGKKLRDVMKHLVKAGCAEHIGESFWWVSDTHGLYSHKQPDWSKVWAGITAAIKDLNGVRGPSGGSVIRMDTLQVIVDEESYGMVVARVRETILDKADAIRAVIRTSGNDFSSRWLDGKVNAVKQLQDQLNAFDERLGFGDAKSELDEAVAEANRGVAMLQSQLDSREMNIKPLASAATFSSFE